MGPQPVKARTDAALRRTIVTEYTHRPCKNCGGDDEYLYAIRGKPLYYCPDCDRTSGSGAELIGADDRREEEGIVDI